MAELCAGNLVWIRLKSRAFWPAITIEEEFLEDPFAKEHNPYENISLIKAKLYGFESKIVILDKNKVYVANYDNNCCI